MVQAYDGTGNESRLRSVDASAKPLTTTDEGRKVDQLLHEHQTYEFGGPAGVTAMMVGFPILMYYLWICLWFYDGKLVYPTSCEDIVPFLARILGFFRPNGYAWKVYTGLVVYQLLLASVMPGYQQEAAALHYCHIFRLTEIIDNYGHIMSVTMIYGFAVFFSMYFITVAAGNEIRMSGNFIYDVFVRISWVIVFFLAVSGGCHQYEQYGYVTPVRPLYHEKWGFMVIFWNFAGVPFLCRHTYTLVCMASHDPSNYQFSTPTYVIIFAVLLMAYYIWDTSLTQKRGTLKKPEFIQTAHGSSLLISGWWRYSRKPNYVADWTMSHCWGAVIGSATTIPYFYSVF
ncbi:ergosterol biosynthesis ERG4/ERG24 family-domain-containing protein [Suillus spraguei]|nr:ergosterol biosynthesis ERG4/ERG24 family-domain-containing protein [Suillus spraguei]